MKKNIDPSNINLKIKAVEIIAFNLTPIDIKSKPFNTFHFNVKINQTFSSEKQLVFILPHVEIIHEDKKTKLGSITISCIFQIDEINNYLDTKTKNINLPETIVRTLHSISLSTCRGVMVSQFNGTFLHNAILPLIDPNSFSDNKK